MDESFDRPELHMQQSGGFLAGLLIFESLLVWIARLVLLTEQEQKDAGIYLGDQRFR